MSINNVHLSSSPNRLEVPRGQGLYSIHVLSPAIQGTQKVPDKCLSHKWMKEHRFYVTEGLISREFCPQGLNAELGRKQPPFLHETKFILPKATQFVTACQFYTRVLEIPPEIMTLETSRLCLPLSGFQSVRDLHNHHK